MATEFRNREPGTDKKFKAVIQYVSHEEFMAEAELLATDLLAEKEQPEEALGAEKDEEQDTPAKISWSKLSTIFPDLKKDNLINDENGQVYDNSPVSNAEIATLRKKYTGNSDSKTCGSPYSRFLARNIRLSGGDFIHPVAPARSSQIPWALKFPNFGTI